MYSTAAVYAITFGYVDKRNCTSFMHLWMGEKIPRPK
jgi:hypothetical protein